MVDLDQLTVSLTKNGYMKIATLVKDYPSDEILNHVNGTNLNITLVRSQVENILGADKRTGRVPALWDDVRSFHERHIQALVFAAVVFSHTDLITTFRRAGKGLPRGTVHRNSFSTEKVYTNLAYAMAEVGIAPYEPGAMEVSYDCTSLLDDLRPVGTLLGRLLKIKLERCGWRDPEEYKHAGDLPFLDACIQQGFHEVFGLSENEFAALVSGNPRRPR
jgi:hypothetical protein